MKVACQTIIWGYRLDDPLEVFQTIYELGYQGVEICQPPAMLPKPDELRAILEALGLEFVGFYGGSLLDRVKYCCDYRPKYLAIEEWDEPSCSKALREGFTLALHPHMYKRNHCLETASILLHNYPELKFLPDTAHLFLARDDPAEAVKLYANRLVAIHLKDWTPKYGRSFHRYARGFVELGNGNIDLEKVLQSLHKIQFDGWIVVEQDGTAYSPYISAETSARWLSEHGIPVTKRVRKENIPKPSSQPKRTPSSPQKLASLMDILIQAKQYGNRPFWGNVLEGFCSLIPCKMATLWEFSPTRNLLGLLAFWSTEMVPKKPFVMDCSKVLSGITIESQVVCHLNTCRKYGDRSYASPELIQEDGVSEMISIPVLNTYNPNHVELVLNLFPVEGHNHKVSDNELVLYANYVAIAYEAILEDVCQSASSAVNLAIERNRQTGKFLDEIVLIVKEVLNCEAVTIFLVDETGKKIVPKATTGIHWRSDVSITEHYYLPGEGLTGKVWKDRRPLLTSNARNEPGYLGKSFEEIKTSTESCLITPFVNPRGEIIGIVRCTNKHARRVPQEVNIFSESDLSIIDTIAQTMVPHLSVLLAEERRAKTLGRLTHELKVPLTVIRGAAEFIQRETKSKNLKFSYPYAENIFSWHDLARRLLDNVDFFRYSVENLRLRLEYLYLFADVFAPARSQIGPLLRERGFSTWSIKDDGFKEIPRVWVDRNLFQQVFFNLISNSIKYAYNDPDAFQIEVVTKIAPRGYEILFRDWGPGIPEGYEVIIFQENIRGPNAEEAHVSGDGLGLWVVAEIIRTHGGTIEVSKLMQPTEFRIWLPSKITKFWIK